MCRQRTFITTIVGLLLTMFERTLVLGKFSALLLHAVMLELRAVVINAAVQALPAKVELVLPM